MLLINKYTDVNQKIWEDLFSKFSAGTFFQTYGWLSLWTKHFGKTSEIWEVKNDDKIIGIIPLLKRSDHYCLIPTSTVLNGQQVSDYGDLIIEKEREKEVIKTISEKCKAESVKLRMDFIREDSTSLPILKELGVSFEEQDVSPYLVLPKTFEEYISSLKRHDRHELRRKMRRFEASGSTFKWFSGSEEEIEKFFNLMMFDEKKKKFLTDPMKLFFKEIIGEFYKKGEGTILFIKSEEKLVAGIVLFYFRDEVLLYNSGFDPSYFHLSPGLIVVTQAIRDSIEKGKKIFDFLRGNERYKYNLGGKDRELYKVSL